MIFLKAWAISYSAVYHFTEITNPTKIKTEYKNKMYHIYVLGMNLYPLKTWINRSITIPACAFIYIYYGYVI